MSRIFSDINVRLDDVNPDDEMVVYDYNAIKSQIIHLIRSEEQEIPYFRVWGLNLKQFLHMPLTENTAELVYEHIEYKIDRFFNDSVQIIKEKSIITLDYNNEKIGVDLVLHIIETGEVFSLPTIEVITNI